MSRIYVAVDIETTGFSPEENQMIEIGAARYNDGKKIEEFQSFVACEGELPQQIVSLTGITKAMLEGAPHITEVMQKFLSFAQEDPLLGHNLGFDYSFLKTAAEKQKISFVREGIDTLFLAKKLLPELNSRTLDALCNRYNIIRTARHRALEDAMAAASLYEHLRMQQNEQTKELFEAVSLCYKVKKQQSATEKQKKYLCDLLSYHRISMEQDVNHLTKSEASRKIDWIILHHGKLPHRFSSEN